MLTIRLARGGAKKRPFYHIVATDSRNARDGRCVERLGYFNPIARGEELRLNIAEERLNYWLSVGATTSPKVTTLLKEQKKHGALTGKVMTEKKASVREKVLAQKAQQKAAAAAEAPAESAE